MSSEALTRSWSSNTLRRPSPCPPGLTVALSEQHPVAQIRFESQSGPRLQLCDVRLKGLCDGHYSHSRAANQRYVVLEAGCRCKHGLTIRELAFSPCGLDKHKFCQSGAAAAAHVMKLSQPWPCSGSPVNIEYMCNFLEVALPS